MTISRRDFLKLSGAGLFALALSELRLSDALALEAPASFQGRATYSGVPLSLHLLYKCIYAVNS